MLTYINAVHTCSTIYPVVWISSLFERNLFDLVLFKILPDHHSIENAFSVPSVLDVLIYILKIHFAHLTLYIKVLVSTSYLTFHSYYQKFMSIVLWSRTIIRNVAYIFEINWLPRTILMQMRKLYSDYAKSIIRKKKRKILIHLLMITLQQLVNECFAWV